MGLNLGDIFPNFEANTTHGPVKFHEWKADKWAILFSHPADFTPVCTTELGHMAELVTRGEFEKRNCKVIAVSCDPVETHKAWIQDILAHQGLKTNDLPYPIIADEKRDLAVQLGMLDDVDKDSKGMPVTARAVFIVGPDNKMKLSLLYPATTGRNFDEILRVLDSLQLTMYHSVATPVNWRAGDRCMILPSISPEDADKKFPKGYEKFEVPSGKGYIRKTPQPNID